MPFIPFVFPGRWIQEDEERVPLLLWALLLVRKVTISPQRSLRLLAEVGLGPGSPVDYNKNGLTNGDLSERELPNYSSRSRHLELDDSFGLVVIEPRTDEPPSS